MKTDALEARVLEPWNHVSYEAALEAQAELSRAGRSGWLLFCCPPTITRGKRGAASDILASNEMLCEQGVRLVDVDRGGQVTYHGPGQIIGFPFGSLEGHTGDPRAVRAFVVALKAKLELFLAKELERNDDSRSVDTATPEDTAGVWLVAPGQSRRKIVSIGLRFGRDAIQHGFALNLEPMDREFSLINACGERGAIPASLVPRRLATSEVELACARLVDILCERR